VVKSTKAPIKPKVRGRHRGQSKFRNNSPNAVTSAPARSAATVVSTQKAFTSFTNTPIVVQPVTNSRFDYENFRLNNATTQPRAAPTTVSPKRDETFIDVPKVSPKTQTTKLQSAPAQQNFGFNAPSSTVKPSATASAAIDDFANRFFGAIPQRVIIPSKLSAEQRLALQASNANKLQSTAASIATPSTTEIPLFNRVSPSQTQNQLRQSNDQKAQSKDFNNLPQKFNFKSQKYEPVEPQHPTTQFYNTQYETKGTDSNYNQEPTRSGLFKQNAKTFAPRQQTPAAQEDNKPTTFNPQQYYQSEQSQYQNLSPRGFSLAAQRQTEQPKAKTPQPEIKPQITSRSETRTHKKFSTLVPKDQYNQPTTFKPNNNNFSKKPVDSISSQKLEKIQNPNKYYSQFTSTPAPSTTQYQTTQQFNQYSTQFQNNFPTTTRVSNFFSSTPSVRPLADGEEDDGQYRPELYEKDFYRNKLKTTKITPAPARNTFSNNFFQSTTTTLRPQNHNYNSGEDEFLKTAHSQNIFASGNQLRAEKEREKFNDFTEKSSPRPFSKPTPVTTTTVKPAKKSKQEKDVSYDYQYYDTAADQHDYADLETIEDFGKTAKKSKSN
jgi:hypothetical protein